MQISAVKEMHLLLLHHQDIYLMKMRAQLCGVLWLYYRFLPPEADYVVSNRRQVMAEEGKQKATGYGAEWRRKTRVR